MRDAYVGNLGDFAKYSLLRALTGRPEKSEQPLPLHTVWFRVRNDMPPEPSTGRGWDYLRHPDRFKVCDRRLFECLTGFGRPEERSLDRVRRSDILPPGTRFRPEKVPDCYHARDRRAAREAWTREMVSKVASQPCRIVFLDPDVGLAPTSLETRASPRHVYPCEVNRFLESDPDWTLVVYQSLQRNRSSRPLERWATGDWHDSTPPILVKFKPPGAKLKSPRLKAPVAFVIFRPKAVQERLDGLTRDSEFWHRAKDRCVP